MQIGLRMAVIKTKRDALALLTPEQRAKEKAEHEKDDAAAQGDEQRVRQRQTNPHGGAQNPMEPIPIKVAAQRRRRLPAACRCNNSSVSRRKFL